MVQADNDDGPTRAIRILVVEDNAALLRTTVRMLADSGYEVLTAENGAEALRLLGGGQRVDILFTDVVLTGPMNGRKVADEAAGLQPGLKVLFTTGYTRNAIIHHGRLDDDVELLGKPFSAADLAARVRKLLDG